RATAHPRPRVPEDPALIGFEGTELAEVVSPQLTTVEPPSRAIGRTAVSRLMKRIDDPDAAVDRVRMDWRGIDRASV
ncbi:substrate-binding domain-containing protein, partial [Klebsiella pneumoniae]|uniref:substrate-binding domain-containing protein n=1 Tax=Klebsiella pneumoniae TaxID=573 RepID=UPI002731B929